MAGQLLGNPSQHGTIGNGAYVVFQSTSEGSHCCAPRWYFTRQEIEEYSPSRKDGIDYKKESQLRKFYCSFIQELGMKLRVPQLTIATAMILCHRFYMHQSHAKNEWQTIASVCMFLASKVEETPRLLKDVIVVAYETINRRDPAAAQRIKQKEVYEKQKELIVIGERLLLATVAFDLNIQHPYKPLVAAIKRLEISHNDLVKVAWNFVNDWLWTTICLHYKPHYIAAGSLYLAAKFHKVKLPAESGKAWWLEFDVSPLQLEEVIQLMLGLLEQKRRPLIPSMREKAIAAAIVEKAVSCGSQSCIPSTSIGGSVSSQGSNGDAEKAIGAAVVEKAVSCGSQSCILSTSIGSSVSSQGSNGDAEKAIGAAVEKAVSCGSQSCVLSASIGGSVSSQGSVGDVGGGDMSTNMKDTDCSIAEKGKPAQCRISDCGSVNSVVEDGNTPEVSEVQAMILESDQISSCKIVAVNVGLSDFDKVRIREALKRRRSERATRMAVGAIDDDDAWIERELEKGIEVKSASAEKRQKLVL